MGGIHYYQSDDQHLAFSDFTFTSCTAQKILFKLTKVSQAVYVYSEIWNSTFSKI